MFNFRPSDEIELKPLDEAALEKAFSVWPVGIYCSTRLFERVGQLHLNVGAFKKDGTLVAWVLR